MISARLKKYPGLVKAHKARAARKRNSMFGADAVAKAKRVKKIRRVVSAHAASSGRQEAGEIIKVLPGGWLKVKWDNGTRPGLIKRSELRRYPGVRNPTKRAAKIKSSYLTLPEDTERVRYLLQGAKYAKAADHIASNRKWLEDAARELQAMEHRALAARRNPGLLDIVSGMQALDYLGGKLKNGRKRRNPKTSYLTLPQDSAQARRLMTKAKELRGLRNLNSLQERRLLEITARLGRLEERALAVLRKKNGTSTSSDVRSPTRTSTSTKAKTTGNVTVTGGAGRGATTTVTIRRNPDGYEQAKKRKRELENEVASASAILKGFPRSSSGLTLSSARNTAAYRSARSSYDKAFKRLREFNSQFLRAFAKEARAERRRNPSISEMSERFQGKATGKVDEYYASDYAPRLNFSRGGKLVFLKLKGTTIRVPDAVVAIDPQTERLWIAGGNSKGVFKKHAAKKGELLDYGPIDAICYLTSKAHIGNGRTYEYVHAFGEEGGRKPTLQIDHEGFPIIKGGSYTIEDRGIVN